MSPRLSENPKQVVSNTVLISTSAKKCLFSETNQTMGHKISITLPNCLAKTLCFQACKQKHNENKSLGSIYFPLSDSTSE